MSPPPPRSASRSAGLDISDASAFGGDIQAGIRFRRGAAGTDVEMRLFASEIDGGAFEEQQRE